MQALFNRRIRDRTGCILICCSWVIALWATNFGCTNCSIDMYALRAMNCGRIDCAIDMYAPARRCITTNLFVFR